jgi:hypothetical protein
MRIWVRSSGCAAIAALRGRICATRFEAAPSLIQVEGAARHLRKSLGDSAAAAHLESAFANLKDAKLRMEVRR